ncbi:GMC oxidoreductase [Methanococcus aeolicus]|uniref:Glucose-methanol-choline oxidoreductase n=1 Tax=Methanococcus aeolicus (strain ATCC BAA-1280 / DSM 17508 / OCM 812 / Nankai-3) TaxID=419665 RepID=A6UTD6_META3|nr:GMC oxidoreductase [Methanococcus aeolicus]ABR55758.1 glucose-methanol-choline oxidoreductase [Methanococcus aeolicus Nankai-3]UXM84136.1 GMC oxidoreductase [Methanococcus aeolicus]
MIYDFIIIGSGVGGSSLFKELNIKYPNKKILLIEKGDKPEYVEEGNELQILYLNGLGGSSMYSVGNAIRIDLKNIGINNKNQNKLYDEIEKELSVNTAPLDYIDNTSKNIMEKYGFKKTPKYINFSKCTKCGNCTSMLCNAKWTPLNYLKEYRNNNLQKTSSFEPTQIFNSKIINNCEVIGIKKDKSQEIFLIDTVIDNGDKTIRKTIKGKTTIVSAGGINSPRILSNTLQNEHLGKNLFVDMFITIGGILKDANLRSSIPMTIYNQYNNDIIISPHYSKLLYDNIKNDGIKNLKDNDIYGLMIKIKDENNGIVEKDHAYKEITENDKKLLSKGSEIASNILEDVGINKTYTTIIRGSHPSGTCAIGKVVNKDLETEIPNLFVCDSSVFPEPLGAPPILGIIAISKNLANQL